MSDTINVVYNSELCNEKHKTIDERIATMEKILEEVRNRPSWIILLIISGLGTSCGAMLMYIITHGGK